MRSPDRGKRLAFRSATPTDAALAAVAVPVFKADMG